MKLINRLKWFFVTNYGRFALGILLCLTGIFSEYSTIEFLSTDWGLFVWTTMAGVWLITGQTLWMIAYALYSWIANKQS